MSTMLVSAGDRHWLGGRYPTVHPGGSLTLSEKSPCPTPVGLWSPASDSRFAKNGGNSTNTCSTLGR